MTARPRREVEAELAEVRWLLYVWYKPRAHCRIDVIAQHIAAAKRLEARLLAELAAAG